MGFPSQAGQLIMKTQSVAGTYDAATGTAGMAFRTRSGSLAPNRDSIIPDPEIGGVRDVSDAYLGAVSWAGDFAWYGRFGMLALLLKAVLGNCASVAGTSSTPSTHTITPVSSTALPWMSVEHAISTSYQTYNYTDAKVNTFHLEADANGYLAGTCGLIARKETSDNVRTPAPIWDTRPMAVGTNITVQYNGLTLPAKTFSFDINNNLETDDFRLGSLYLGDITEKRREITMGCTIRPADSTLWKQATYGSGATNAPVGLTAKQPAVITINSYETVPGVTPTVPFSLVITVPSAVIQPFGAAPSGDDVLQHDITMQGLAPNPATPILTAVVKNDLPIIP